MAKDATIPDGVTRSPAATRIRGKRSVVLAVLLTGCQAGVMFEGGLHPVSRSSRAEESLPHSATVFSASAVREVVTPSVWPEAGHTTMAGFESEPEGGPRFSEPPDAAEPAPLPAEVAPPVGERPAEGPSVPVSLNQAIAESLAQDPVIQAAAEGVRQAEGEFVTASLLPNPTLLSEMAMLPIHGRFTPEREGGPPEYTLWAEYPIDWWLFGKRLAEMESAQKEIEVTSAEVADIVRTRVADTMLAFYNVLEAQALLEIAQLDVDNLERVEEMTRELVELGAVGTVELDRVRLELIGSRRELRDSRVDVVSAKAELQALMGREFSDPDFEVDGSLEVPDPVAPLELEQAWFLAEANRPDILALQKEVEQAAADVRLERKQAWPELSVGGGYIRQFQRRVLEMPDADSYGVGVEMSLPIFDRNQGEILAAEAALRRARLELRATRLEVRAEIEGAVETFRQAHGIVTTEAPAQFEAATRVRDSFEEAYRLGARSFLEILDAQRAFRETSRLFIVGQAGYWRSLTELNAAVGRRVWE